MEIIITFALLVVLYNMRISERNPKMCALYHVAMFLTGCSLGMQIADIAIKFM